MTTLKITGSILYSFVTATLAVKADDSYEAVFSDIFFWAAAFLGTALMLLVEKADPKTQGKITTRRILFSIAACLSIVFMAGTVRASMLEDVNFERNHWFYGIVLFFCAIAPELVRLIITDSPRKIAKGFNDGIENRVRKMVGGDDSEENNVEHLNTDENE